MTGLSHQKLFIHDHLNARELSEVYFSEPTNRGQLFIILELPKEKIDQQGQIDQIIRQAANQFSRSQQDDPEMILEEILQKMNQVLPEIIPPKINHWLNTLDLAFGIIAGDAVYIASIGSLQGLLIHHNQVTPILEKTEKVNPVKIFSDIVSGELDPEDVLIISTNALFDYISQEKIRQIVKKYTPNAAVQEIKNLLETVPNFVNFNSIVIKKLGQHDLDQASYHPVKETNLSQNEEINEPITRTTTNRSPSQAKTKLVVDFENLQKIKIISWSKTTLNLAMVYFALVGKTCKKIWKGFVSTYKFLTSKQYRLTHENNLLEKTQEFFSDKLSWFIKLSWQKKVLIIGLFMVTLIFLQSLVFLTQGKSIAKKDLVYDQTIQKINSALNDVQASLIYNDEKRAEELLLEIKTMLGGLQPNSQEQRDEIAQAEDKTARILNDVRHINYVSDPLQLFDLSSLTDPKQIVQKNDQFYVLDKTHLYLLANDQATSLLDFNNGLNMADWPEENKLILGNNEQFLIFDLADKTSQIFTFSKSSGNTQVQDTAIFGNNLYVLDTINNNIFKYTNRGQSFGNGQSWLQEDIDLANIHSFTIDGDVYLISNNGQITKLNRGRKTTFNYYQPHPPLGKGITIKTFTNSNYLYMIDPDNQRIVILDKEGTIKDQYTSPKFDHLTDLAINTEESAIYLLNGSQVYLLAINK